MFHVEQVAAPWALEGKRRGICKDPCDVVNPRRARVRSSGGAAAYGAWRSKELAEIRRRLAAEFREACAARVRLSGWPPITVSRETVHAKGLGLLTRRRVQRSRAVVSRGARGARLPKCVSNLRVERGEALARRPTRADVELLISRWAVQASAGGGTMHSARRASGPKP